MLDGRIDTQGTVEDLRDQGVLEHITYDAAADLHKDEMALAEAKEASAESSSSNGEGDAEEGMAAASGEAKKPRKLVKDEHREIGGVKWDIYKSYLKAS